VEIGSLATKNVKIKFFVIQQVIARKNYQKIGLIFENVACKANKD